LTSHEAFDYDKFMPKFTCQAEVHGAIYIIRTSGYLDESGGRVIVEAVEEAFPKGFRNFVLNFKGSPVINSQGIAQIIELTEIVVDEKKGSLAFVGLNELTAGVFKMVGLLKVGKAFPDETLAINELKIV